MMETDASEKVKKLTVMIFCGGDNMLAPSMISQLKGIKDAGFHKDVSVLVRFDPNEQGVKTSVFDVNFQRKKDREKEGRVPFEVGDGRGSFVRNLGEDVVKLTCPKRAGQAARAKDALEVFLTWCRQKRPADHYLLFLIGHGMIVGNDAFLPDEHPSTSITLRELRRILHGFNKGLPQHPEDHGIEEHGGVLELVGMHSCSMSAIEVAYELKGEASYMMASEGVSFVGTLPYRQLLKKTFNTVRRSPDGLDEDKMQVLLQKLFYLSLHNSTDFKFAGFSADLALCSLDPQKFEGAEGVKGINEPLRGLTRGLKKALKTECGQQLVLMAHWKSQSYWQENYTDLYDFCRCLSEKCDATQFALCIHKDQPCIAQGELDKLKAACDLLMETLEPPEALDRDGAPYDDPDPDEGPDEGDAADEDTTEKQRRQKAFSKLVVFSEHLGPSYQYSHGLSVYFPWSKPIEESPDDVAPRVLGPGEEDDGDTIIGRYEKYAFTADFRRKIDESVEGVDSEIDEVEYEERAPAGDPKGKKEKWIDKSWLSFLLKYFEVTRRKSREEEDNPRPTEGESTEKSVAAEAVPTTTAGIVASDAAPFVAVGGGVEALDFTPPAKSTPPDSGGVGCNCGSIKNYPMVFSMSPGAHRRQRPGKKTSAGNGSRKASKPKASAKRKATAD